MTTCTDVMTFAVRRAPAEGVRPETVSREFLRAFQETFPREDPLVPQANLGTLTALSYEGGSVDSPTAAALYGGPRPVTPEAVRKAARAGKLIGIQDATGRWHFPRWQFTPDGGTLPGLREALRLLRKHHPHFAPMVALLFFLNANHALQTSPLQALREGRVDEVATAARAAGD